MTTASAAGPGTLRPLPPRRRPGALALRATEYWLRAYRATWRGSVVSGFLAPLLYLGSLGFGLGSMVRGGVGGVPYVAFVAPGVLAANAMQTCIGESTYPVMGAIKWQRQYHAMLAAPLGVADLLLGHLLYIVLRAAFVVVAFVGIGAALGVWRSWWILLAIPVAVLGGVAHAAPVMAYASRQESDGGFTLVFRFGVIPMFLFAGTFFPVEQLPVALAWLARVTPLWHVTQLCRELSLGVAAPLSAAGHLAYLLLWLGVGARLAYVGLHRRLVA
ncbi:MAG TPA: ABC transporter permease [Kineosporiaceae bacterium]|nr:ABC transporter permease [Kineosporiaceae bacterium]